MNTKNETLRQKHRMFKTVTRHKIDEITVITIAILSVCPSVCPSRAGVLKILVFKH